MTEVRRRGRPGHDRESVLATSVALFTAQGYEGTSVEDLARGLGVGKSALYHHVTGKQALLELALDRALTGLEELAGRVQQDDARAVEQLEQLVRGSVQVLVDRLPYVTLLLRVRGNTAVERRALTRRRRLDRLGAELVRRAVDDGDLRSGLDPAVTARLLFGTVNSLTEWLRPGARHDADQLADMVVAMAFQGLRAGPSSCDTR